MKVIGMTNGTYSGDYICTVTHTELEKFMGLYYDKMKRLEVGATLDLGKGYDHALEIKSALDATRRFVRDNQAVIRAICSGLSIEALARAAQEVSEDGAQEVPK